MRKSTCLVGVISVALSAPVAAQDANVCQAQEQALANFQDEFKGEEDDIKTDADDLQNEAPANLKVSGEIKFEDTHTALDLPQITMKNRQFSFSTPTAIMKSRKFSWSVPEITMENKKVGQYPSTTCHWLSCTVHWHDIITKVPVTKMVRKEAATNIPEFTMHLQKFSTAIPEIKMVRKDMYYKLPHITVANPIPEEGPIEERSKKISDRANQLSARMNARSTELTDALFDCHRNSIIEQRDSVAQTYEQAIKQLNAAIDFVRAQGADPARFQPGDAPEGQTIDLLAQRDQLIADRDKTLAEMDKALSELNRSNALTVDPANANKA